MGDRGNQREPNGVTMTERPPFSQADKEEDARKTQGRHKEDMDVHMESP